METLTSLRNPALKAIRKALAQGSLTAEGLCVAEGFHLLDEALRSGCRIEAVFATALAAAEVEHRMAHRSGVRVSVLPPDVFQTISSTETPQGVVVLVAPPAWSLDDCFRAVALVLVLDGIQDPGNAGAMLRAAEAFGASGAVLLKGSVSPYNAKALRASAGSVFRLPLITAAAPEDLFQALARHASTLFALMPAGAAAIDQCRLAGPCALVVGSEGRGVSPLLENRAKGLRIPTLSVESLNAAMAVTVVLYEAHKQRTAVGP